MVIGEKGSDMVLGKPALEPLILLQMRRKFNQMTGVFQAGLLPLTAARILPLLTVAPYAPLRSVPHWLR